MFLKMPDYEKKRKQLDDIGINPSINSIEFKHGEVTMHPGNPNMNRYSKQWD